MVGSAHDRTMWKAREDWLDVPSESWSHDARALIRPEIERSWRRCQMAGTGVGTVELPYDPDLRLNSQLRRIADPVLTRLEDALSDTPVTILLADRDAQIVDRRAGTKNLLSQLDSANVGPGFGYAEEYCGTNAIGTALEDRRLFKVRGGEHYREALQSMACVGKPIIHPVTRRVEGILDITCSISDVSPLMGPLVDTAVQDIETRMYEQSSVGEKALLMEFMKSAGRGTGTVVGMSHGLVLANPAALQLLDVINQDLLLPLMGPKTVVPTRLQGLRRKLSTAR